MNVVKPGKFWWDGMEVTCPDCGQVVKLDPSDQHKRVPDHGYGWIGVTFLCEMCGGRIRVEKPKPVLEPQMNCIRQQAVPDAKPPLGGSGSFGAERNRDSSFWDAIRAAIFAANS